MCCDPTGTFWQGVVPRGTVSATKWVFVCSSAVLRSFLWLGQSRKDLFCVWDQDGQMHPTTVQLPQDTEMVQRSACRDALWGLNYHGRIHIRTLSTSPTGMHLLDLSQLGKADQHIVWACDGYGMVYFRMGMQPLSTSMMVPAWICIEPPEQ
ncbi:unnamed protein product, partial [Coregonus sp. 'balchen']